jgi:hypothetical protein
MRRAGACRYLPVVEVVGWRWAASRDCFPHRILAKTITPKNPLLITANLLLWRAALLQSVEKIKLFTWQAPSRRWSKIIHEVKKHSDRL